MSIAPHPGPAAHRAEAAPAVRAGTRPVIDVRDDGDGDAGRHTGPRWRRTVRAYVMLTKPRIIELLLVTTLPAMLLAADGLPDPAVALATLVGGSLAAGSANAFNQYFDRDIDAVMRRTHQRPLPRGDVSPRAALVFSLVLAIVSLSVVLAFTTALAALLTLTAILLYVVLYTLVLKRRTPQNIVWGGAAGCMPVLIAWAAVTGTLAPPAWALFLVVFFWTPPHYWPLSLRFRDDYAAVDVPMLPVVAPPVSVARQVLGHTAAMIAATLALVPLGGMGPVYTVTALVAGAVFAISAAGFARRLVRGEAPHAMRLFHMSISYLTVVFAAVAVDALL